MKQVLGKNINVNYMNVFQRIEHNIPLSPGDMDELVRLAKIGQAVTELVDNERR